MTDRKTAAFKDNGASEHLDMSSGRLARLRARIGAVPFAVELLDIEAQVAAPTAFDQQMESVGHCFPDNGSGKPAVVLNPRFSDDKLASFYVHEMAHLRQMCVAEDVYVAHPLSMCDLLLGATLVKEADAYLRQGIFACCAFVQGDRGILEDLKQVPSAELEKQGVAGSVTGRLSGSSAEDFLNEQFWVTLRQVASDPALLPGYFNDVIAAVRAARDCFRTLSFAQMSEVDGLPPLSAADFFMRVKAIATFSRDGGAEELDYFRAEDAQDFQGKVFSMLPPSFQEEFLAERTSFVRAFYEAMEGARTDSKSAPKIWTPGGGGFSS